jgi:hypothetical protein
MPPYHLSPMASNKLETKIVFGATPWKAKLFPAAL